MEAVPRLPMVHFDLKTPLDRPLDFTKVKQYIREFYNEDPESYNSEIRNLESLRATAVRPVKDVAGCSVLKKYFCQLHFLQSRFPMGKEGKAAINFSWKDAYGHSVTTAADIKVEMVAVLYNIGALHSQLGSADDRTSAEGLKLACTHFQCAAWAFQHLKDSYPQPAGMELSPDVMQFKYHLCLAQAQECILEKSMTDNRKATINAKVATQIVDYYNLALNALLQPPAQDDPAIQDIVGSKVFKNWKKYMKFKVAYYCSISLLYQGMQSEEQQKMGERVAYFQGALNKLMEAIKLSKGLDQSEAVMETLVFTRDVVEGKRKAAKNENEFIYHEEVPELDSLPNVKGASLVKGIPFSVNDQEISGTDIFSRLVPMRAHEASSLYSEEKAKLLRRISSLIDSKDEEIVSFMSCLQLEYLKSHLESTNLPQEVVDRCAALSAMPDAIPNLMAAMDKLNEAYQHIDGMLKEINELIKEEEIAEKEYQSIMGSRPPSIVATDLTREANKYTEAHKKAAESNDTLHKAMTQHIENMRVLQKPLSEIQSGLPNLSPLNLHEDQSLNEVITLVNKVNEMRKQRAMLASQLRESVCSDDITGQLITRADEKLEDIFSKEMQKHDKYVMFIEQNLAAQENIIRALTDAYAKYAPTRKATTEIMRQRDTMLTALISSYDAYEDLLAKSSKGQDFYRKLETNLTKLLQRVKGTCKVQQEERDSILEQNSKKALKIAEAATASTESVSKLKYYLQNKETTIPTSPYYSPITTSAESNKTWLPGVRPAPVGSEGNSSLSKPADPTQVASVYNSQSYYNSYPPSALYQYHMDASKAYANPSAYYYQTLYAQNSALKSLQYPSMPDGSQSQEEPYDSYKQNTYNYNVPVNTAAYRTDHDYSAPAPSSGYSSSSSSTPKHIPPQQTPQEQYSQQGYPTTAVVQQTFPADAPATSQPNYSLGISQQASPVTTTSTTHQQPYTSGVSQPYPGQVTSPVMPQQNYSDGTSQQTYTGQVSSSLQLQNYSGSPSQPAYQGTTGTFTAGAMQQTYTVPSSPAIPPQNYSIGTSQQNYSVPVTSPSTQQNYSVGVSQSTYTVPVTSTVQQNYTVGGSQAYQGIVSATPQQNYSPLNYSQSQSLPSQNYMTATQNQTVSSTSQPSASPIHSNLDSATNKYTQPYNPTTNAYTPTTSTDGQNYSANYSHTASANFSTTYPSYTGYNNYFTSTAGAPQEWSHQIDEQQKSQQSGYYKAYETSSTGQPYSGYSYTNTYPQAQFQQTPGTDTSYYSRAGNKNTVDSTVSPTYGSSNEANSELSQANMANYYSQPYGYQFYDNSWTSDFQNQNANPSVARQNSVTYMQSNVKNNLTVTYSQQQHSSNKEASNVDLLAGLDFNVSDAPLLPTQPVDKNAVDKTQDQLKNLSISGNSQTQSSKLAVNNNNLKSFDQSPAKPELVERPSPSKTPIKDPFSDPDSLAQFVQEVEKFEKFVEGLNSKTLNGPTALDLKWNELQDIQEKDSHKLSISVARCYPMKNRFADILPFDSTRVELPSTKDDYINASFIKELGLGCPNFIMTQSPLPSTYADFWCMVLEQHVELVVCLVAECQMNGEIYWPVSKTEYLMFGKVKVTLQSSNVRTHWVERIFSVSDGKTSIVVMHLEFTAWPHNWLPESPGPLLNLVNEAHSVWSQQRGCGPIVVHCQSGVGRSGVFVFIALCMSELRLPPIHLPDTIGLIAKIGKLRKNPLRDRQHLQLAYQCLLYYAQDLLMKRGILASRSTFEEKRTKPKSHTRHPSEDFLLNTIKDQERRQSDASSTSSSSKPNENDPLSQIDPLWPIKRYS
ncbi:tyrosine-protein phosphatase non-receptor type 23 [Cimex lectularius]|uniref:Tyrosine-protein phosphatase non-receptor type 23 n=1 Tax=Cimex lectularius TaxID=79782 RepID=A0A8I6S046_CIMLE|nr:tyrosine-protein phosphatase non-receptor type 23 [Cimex lectularius]